MHTHFHGLKNIVDAINGVVVIGSVFGWLPAIAAILSIVWNILRLADWAVEKWKAREMEAREK